MLNTAAVALVWCNLASPAPSTPDMGLTRGPEALCRIVVATGQPDELLTRLATQAITGPVHRWSGVELPIVRIDRQSGAEEARRSLASPSIVLATFDELQRIAPDLVRAHDLLLRVESLDEHGYVCLPVDSDSARTFLVIGRTPRAVYNGAVYVGERRIDGPADRLSLAAAPVVRSAHLKRRPVYLLTIWGEEDEYAVQDHLKVYESFARDGATHIYFWLSGHFPSKRFPQTFKVNDNNWDSTEDTRIGTVEDQRRLISGAHALGMRFYIGGALGAWCGTFMLTNRAPGTMRTGSLDESTGKDVSEWALCQADERSREALIAYYTEMMDALPEADGLYIESADEYGECACERCRQPVDAFGSRMFGQYQLTLVQRLMHEVWKKHPRAELCYTIGYTPHAKDPAYYQVVRQMSADDRIEWMEARNSWTFPGPSDQALPAVFFSPRILHWEYYDSRPLDTMVQNTWRAATSGMAGSISTFSPGFNSGSFYHQVPLPTDRLPYVLTHFVHREATWDPNPDAQEFKRRVGERFLGRESPEALVEAIWSLREILRATTGKKINRNQLEALARMERLIEDQRPQATPKRREGMELMVEAIADIRRICTVQTKPAASRP